MTSDGPAAQLPDTVKVRGRLRAVWLPLWLAGAAGCVLFGVYEGIYEDIVRHRLLASSDTAGHVSVPRMLVCVDTASAPDGCQVVRCFVAWARR